LLHVKELQLLRSDFTDYCTHVLSIEKLTKKLLSPEKLTLDELTKELKKKKVAIDDFNIFKSIKDLHVTMMQLKQQIDAIDAEIDNLVYQLYGLSDEEIHTVQQR
ncbi:MAG: hypothetical protein U9N52_12865, partial [Campylobacterota bacterium]|nr:hypothetical protein [Campylobacterota bacterium]